MGGTLIRDIEVPPGDSVTVAHHLKRKPTNSMLMHVRSPDNTSIDRVPRIHNLTRTSVDIYNADTGTTTIIVNLWLK